MKEQSLKAGTSLIIYTNVQGMPTPTVKWSQNDKELVSSSQVTIETEATFSRLTIKGVTGKDAGKVKAVAENKVGKDEAEFTVSIKGIENQSWQIIFQPIANEILENFYMGFNQMKKYNTIKFFKNINIDNFDFESARRMIFLCF